ncbi:GNAT family N-acetyltransferase [Fictibacillus nanhaiensis]|uniref:GNAT family N-acetyltransferase n=1 Tax=Fictibacillus nanhaiensis TaxID=742169 RepID=UPI001C946239|nr:GNAT family N-acetyltransferase [Fictibacillus nanhaiensis]MBY6038219.1 GNAT family N-acetyltransferase [Fictibacillus nanhaiensis]
MEKTTMEISLSTPADYEGLVEIDHLVWNIETTPAPDIRWDSPEAYGRKFPAGTQIVARCNGKVCGYIFYQDVIPVPSNQHVADVAMAVHPDFHRQNIGSELMRAVEQLARDNGKTKLSLRVLSTNKKAILFYKKCGFVEQGRLVKEFCLNGRYVDDLLLYKHI